MTEASVAGQPLVHRVRIVALTKALPNVYLPVRVVLAYLTVLVGVLLSRARIDGKPRIATTQKDSPQFAKGVRLCRRPSAVYQLQSCFCLANPLYILITFLALRNGGAAAAVNLDGNSTAAEVAAFLNNYTSSDQFETHPEFPKSGKISTLEDIEKSEFPQKISLLQGNEPAPRGTDGYVNFAVCDSGIYSTAVGTSEVQVVVAESRSCWQLCRFLEDKLYPFCESENSPVECFHQQFAADPSIPGLYRNYCNFEEPTKECPLFAKTDPDNDFCLKSGMEKWRLSRKWSDLTRKQGACSYVKWDPTTTGKALPSPYIDESKSQWASALRDEQFATFYVVARDVEILAADRTDPALSEVESSIIPARYWDAKRRKGGWTLVAKFTAPERHGLFEKLTISDDGTNSAANICLYETSRGPGKDVKFGMLPGTDECAGKIGVLRVAALSTFPATSTVDRETGLNLCVARRWVRRTETKNGYFLSTVEAMQRVALESNCASGTPAFQYGPPGAKIAGEWEHFFLALLYPLTKGISGVTDSASCPWEMSIQYGLKCFAAVELGSAAYSGTFPESQIACRRLALNLGVPSNFSRLAVVQNDHDFRLLNFISPPESTAWVGFYQRTQVLLSTVTSAAENVRVPELSCPEEILASPGKSVSRMSELKPRCEAAGSLIDDPVWESTWSQYDGHLTYTRRWDIPWCVSHPRVVEWGRFLDCAALWTGTDGSSCVYSAPCDATLPSICTFPVYYPPGISGQSVDQKAIHLSPRIRCTRTECVVRFQLSGKESGGLFEAKKDFLGVPFAGEAFVAIKSTCMSVTSMIGPYKVEAEVNLAVVENFQKLNSGLYDVCYCSLVPNAGRQTDSERCKLSSHYRQLVATLVLEEAGPLVRLEGALQVPLAILRPPAPRASSNVAIDTTRSKMLGDTIVSCAWRATRPLEMCKFYLRTTAGPGANTPTKFTLYFVPLTEEVDDTNLCGGRAEAQASGDISVDAAVSVPLEQPTAEFYAVCERSGHCIGSLFFPESVVLPKRPKSLMQLTFPTLSVKKPLVTLTILDPNVEASVKISHVVVLAAKGPGDTNCSWAVLQNSEDKDEYSSVKSVENGSIMFQLIPRVGYGKICYVSEQSRSGESQSTRYSGYVDFMPPASTMTPLTTAASRCFAVPVKAPCRIEATPQALPLYDNPHELAPFFPNIVRLYAIPDGAACPTTLSDPLYAAFAGNEDDISAVENSPSVALKELYALGNSVTFELPETFKVWLKKRRTALLCWLHSETSVCSSNCATAVGRLYWIEAETSNAENNEIVCGGDGAGDCLIPVRGVNMNLFESATGRLAAFNQCEEHTQGIGTLSLGGVYHNAPLKGIPALAFPAARYLSAPLPTGEEGGLAKVSETSQQESFPFIDYMDFSSVTAEFSSAFNSTSISYKSTYTLLRTVQELCFDGAKTTALNASAETYQRIGYLIFKPEILTAETKVTSTENNAGPLYEVAVTLKGDDTQVVQDYSFMYTKIASPGRQEPVACDLEKDLANIVHRVRSSEVKMYGESKVLADYKLPHPSQPVAFCWSITFSSASGEKVVSPSSLLGYSLGPPYPKIASPLPSCSLESIAEGCRLVLVPILERQAFSGGFFIEAPTSLLETGMVVMLQDPTSSCPPNPASDIFSVHTDKSYVLERTSSGPSQQELSVPVEGLGFLARTGKGVLCYAARDCIPASADQQCTKELGFLRWLGPVPPPADWLIVCEQLDQSGCIVTIKGHGFDLLNYSVPLLAVKPDCLSSTVYQTAYLHKKPGPGFREDSAARESSSPSSQSVLASTVQFAIPYMPTSVGALCWDAQGAAGGTSRPLFEIYLGTIIFVPFPFIEAKQWNVDPTKGTSLHLRINVVIELSSIEQLTHPPSGEHKDDHYLYQMAGDSSACEDPTASTERLLFTRSSSRLMTLQSRIQAASPTTVSSEILASDVSSTVVETVDLEYEVQLWADPTQLCWRSVFYDKNGQKLYDYITRVDSLMAVSVAELDDNAPNHPESKVALCGQLDNLDDCTVTIKPESASPLTPRFLPTKSQVFLLRGDVSCPTDVDDDILTLAKDGAEGSIPDAAVAVKMIAGEWGVQDNSQKFFYPVKNKKWVGISGVASICWAYGSKESCPLTEKKSCVLKIGLMYWRGPLNVTPILVLCEDASGCEVQIEGMNLHTLDHSYSRVALLRNCGKQGGLGLIEVIGLPEGYLPPESAVSAVNHFEPEEQGGQGPFFVYSGQVVELVCEEGTTVVLTEASWQREESESGGKTCQPLDVLTTVNNWCGGLRRCRVHPYLAGSELPSVGPSASPLQGLPLPDPCSTGDDLILSGSYTCSGSKGRGLALIEDRARTTSFKYIFKGSWSSTKQYMKFAIPPSGSRTYRICWNPNNDLTLKPELYTTDLGLVQILPTAGISDIRKVASSPVDDAKLEIYIRSVLDPRSAKESFIYTVPPSDGTECDQDTGQALSRVRSYVSLSEGTSILMYTISAPEVEMTLCWNWMAEALVSATGVKQRNLLGIVPGSTNPAISAWGELICGGDTNTVCAISIRPAPWNQRESLTSKSQQPKARVRRHFQNLEPFFQKHYSVYLLEDTGACPADPTDVRYTAAGAKENSLKLTQFSSNPTEVIKELGRTEKQWLAERFDGRLCWVNDGACGSLGLKACVADIGVVSWVGPIPLDWDVSPLRVRCKRNSPCEIVISGRNLFLMDLTTSRVAVLESCGDSAGPGIATEISTEHRSSHSTLIGSPSLLQNNSVASNYEHRAASPVASYGAWARDLPKICTRETGCVLYGSTYDVALGVSNIEADSRVVPNLSKSETFVAMTVLKEARNYMICWNPHAGSSSDLSMYTLPIGEVLYYGFQVTRAWCFSGSTCALLLSVEGANGSDIQVALKDVDCSDLTLSTGLGDGILHHKSDYRFELADRIPGGPVSLKTYQMCWCDKRYIKSCSPTDYSDQVGVLDVRVLPYTNAFCSSAQSQCFISVPSVLKEDEPAGRLLLVEDSSGARECRAGGNTIEPSTETINDRMQFSVNVEKDDDDDGSSFPSPILICWMPGEAESQIPSTTGAPLFSRTPALLGVITNAGPRKLQHQKGTRAAPVGVRLHVEVAVTGFSRLVGVDIDHSMDEGALPQQWRHVLVVPGGMCGQSAFVHRLKLTRVVSEDKFQTAVYEDTNVMGFAPEGVEQLDVCWCTEQLACSADAHYALKVAELNVISPQKVDVACTYDTKCPFEYETVHKEANYGMHSQLVVTEPGCTAMSVELPGNGFLVQRTEITATDVASGTSVQGEARQREIQEFSSLLSRNAVSKRRTTTREFAICYCAIASSGCTLTDLVEVGKLLLYDVWVGTFKTNPVQPVEITISRPPFSGINGKVYISGGDGQLEREIEAEKSTDEPTLRLNLSPVLDLKPIPSSVSVLYCEGKDAAYCASPQAERVKVAEVNFQGFAEKNWVGWCHLGTRCRFDVNFFLSEDVERIAMLSSCASPNPNHDYGVSDLGFGTDNEAVVTMTFEWRAALPDNGLSSYDACWCNKSTGKECTSMNNYTLKVGEVKVTGLQRSQDRTCHVGTVCTAENLKGYNLRKKLSLRIFENACDHETYTLERIPQKGFFSLLDSEETMASFTLKEKLQGPSEVTVDKEATTGLPPSYTLKYTGQLDLQRDFVILDTDKDCSHTNPFKPPLPMYGWLPLTSSGSVDTSHYPFLLRGGIYFVCYCRAQKSALPTEAGGNPFYDESAAPDEELCNVPSAYKTLVGVLLVSGPHELEREYTCVAGGSCHVDVLTTYSGSVLSRNHLSSSLIELKEVSCKDAGSAASARVQDWTFESKYSTTYETHTLSTHLQTFAFSSHLVLTGGTYKVCWKSSPSAEHYLEIGRMYVTGPHRSTETVEVMSGKEFTLAVKYVGSGDDAVLKDSRIRMVPTTNSETPPQQLACAEQPWSVGFSAAFRYTNLFRPPDSIEQHDGPYQVAVWDNVVLVVDAKTPEYPPGSLFAVCFCNGSTSDCSLESSYFMQVASLQVTGFCGETSNAKAIEMCSKLLPASRNVLVLEAGIRRRHKFLVLKRKDVVSYTCVIGPAPEQGSYRVQIGRPVTYIVSGFRLPTENYLVLLPSTDPATRKAYSCGDSDTEKLFSVAIGTTAVEGENQGKVLFDNVLISAPSKSVTICWCGGTDCSVGTRFRVEIGKMDVEYPEMDEVSIIPEGVFSIVLRGSMVHFSDRITVVSPDKICGYDETEKMDPTLVTIPSNSSDKKLDDLGKGQLIKDLPPENGKNRWLWSSWPIQATAEATKTLKVCYCSGSEGACVGESRFNAWIGNVTVLVLPNLIQQIELKGNSFSLSNRLKYFITHRSIDTPSADLRILCALTPDADATVVAPDWVDDTKVSERFVVSMSPGYRYILCWSLGSPLSGEAGRVNVAEPRQMQDEASLSALQASSSAETQAPTLSLEGRLRWNFLADFTPTGFRSGQVLTAVVKMEDQLVIRGSPNVTDLYTAYIGEEGRGRDCEEVRERSLAVLEDVTEVTEQHIIFQLPEFHSTGLYPICILNVNLNLYFDVGIIKVEKYYWKSVYEIFQRNRLIMYPCSSNGTSRASEAGGNKLYMPDGMGVWTADVESVQTDKETSIPILRFGKGQKGKWIDFYEQGLRSTVACTSHDNDIYFLGPNKLVTLVTQIDAGAGPVSPTLTPRDHDLPTPIDITVKYPLIFITDYQSPMILVLSYSTVDFRRRIFPTDPALLFAAGIQALDVGGKTLLAVADMINHIVGSVYVELDDTKSGDKSEIIRKSWNSIFGRPKVPLRNAQGLAYPFTLGHYKPTSSAAADASGHATSLLMVGEVGVCSTFSTSTVIVLPVYHTDKSVTRRYVPLYIDIQKLWFCCEQLVTQRVLFLEPTSSGLQFYRQILLPERLMVSGLHFIGDYLFVAARNWFKDVDVADSNAYILIMKLSDLVESRYFTYPDFRTKFQSGIRYSFMPIVSGPPIHFFREDKAHSNMEALGLKLNPETGEISGLISHTGEFRVSVIGGDLLGSYTWTLKGEAGCRAGDYYNTELSLCEPCPIGTFRDQEAELQRCETHKPNSSTLSVGSTQLAQCQCIAGFEIGTLGACTPCPAGTYKATVSDTNCTGKCPANMRSSVVGANSEEALNCVCDAGYYMDGDSCKPCPVGSYCRGDLDLPIKCPEYQTTKGAVAKHADDCVCIPGFTSVDGECMRCSRLTYKSAAGDEACTACPQPASFSDSGAILLASTQSDEAEYTFDSGATQSQECRLCASGYFFDSASGGCMPCSKNFFCPGGEMGSKSCAENSLTLYGGAETPFACKCPKGYGKIAERNPVDLTIVCVECPRDTFQHIEGADTQCIPCPSATTTKTTKSTSFAACVASPGYFFPEKLEQILVGMGSASEYSATSGEESESAGIRTDAFTVDFASIRLAESKYELMTDELLNVPRICQPGDTLIQLASPEIKMQSYTENLDSCIQACARNVYCTSLTFRHGGAVDPSFPTVVTNHTGVYIISRWPCELHFYGRDLLDNDLRLLRDAQQKNVDSDIISCILDRPEGDSIWKRLMYQECPLNAYCPGDKEAQIYECPSSSVTLAPRASSVDQCKCIPGYRSVAGQCEPCRIGTYKNTTSNLSCTECPSSFTTASVASISAYDCVCLPGLYMKISQDVSEEMSLRADTADTAEDTETNNLRKSLDERAVEPEPPVPPSGEAEDDAEEEEEQEEEEEEEESENKEDADRSAANTKDATEAQEKGADEGKKNPEPEAVPGGGASDSGNISGDVANEWGSISHMSYSPNVRDAGGLETDYSHGVQVSASSSATPDELPVNGTSESALESMSLLHIPVGSTSSVLPHFTGRPGLVGDRMLSDNALDLRLRHTGDLVARQEENRHNWMLSRHAAGRGGVAGIIFMPDENSSYLDGTEPKWLEPSLREKLEKYVRLHQCTACYKQMYCPGLWLDPPYNRTHMPPQLCPVGSNVPSSTVIADSIEKCLCLPGYSYVGGGSGDRSVTMNCSKCAPGTYKELQENSPCAGRCMKDAETIEGAVAKIQCFCKVGKYAVESTGTDALFTCQDCLKGGVCPGGFKKRVREGIEMNHSFVNITIHDHQVPFPSKNFFAVYKERGELLWDPSLVPMSSSFTGDTYIADADMEYDLFRQNTIVGPNFLDMPVEQDQHDAKVVVSIPESLKSFEKGLAPRSHGPFSQLTTHGSRTLSLVTSFGGTHMGMLQTAQTSGATTPQIVSTLQYERIPDIHACFEDRRCEGGPHNMCSRGSAGYLCSACEPGYSTTWYRSLCQSCFPLWFEIVVFLAVRLAVCLVIWLLASLSIIASEQRELVHPILLRILLSNYFLFSVFGLMPETSVSMLFEWAPLYRAFFFTSYFCSHPYSKLACVFQELGYPLEYRHAWYLQRVFQISVPLLDALLITLMSVVAVSLYKGMKAGRIQQIHAVLRYAEEARGDEFWTACTIKKVENDRCLGLFRYLTSASVLTWTGFKSLLADLIPAYTVIWFWHYPALVIQASELVNCVAISYKDEPPLSVLSAMPMQTCKLNNMVFLGGFIIGIAVLVTWGVGTIVFLVVWVQHSQDSDPIVVRFRRSFLANGYQVQYRAWEAVLTVRKGLVAVTMAMHVHDNSAGAEEVFRSSANLALSVVYVMMQLIMEPYDKRSHNLANRVEFYGLLAHIINGVILQGSYYFDAFKYIGPIPILVTSLFYVYVLWNLFVEWGRAVIMRPYLAKIPSLWRYYNRVTRSLARLYTAENAKIYYNYITKDMVVEAAAKLRVFHIQRLLRHRGYESSYRKINYENRLYFVAALTDSLSQLVIAWCQFTIPGDWLDFTIRYAFCYCFWQRHQGAVKFRVPLDSEDFDSIKPDLFSDWYHKTETTDVVDLDDEQFEGKGYVCNQAEEELLQLMLDDDVYDDSPITLMELYVAVQSMRYIPQMQLRRLHHWYRERIAHASNTLIPELRKENDELKTEIEELNETLRQMVGAQEIREGPSFSLMDFFFAVEMVQQARLEAARLQEEIEKASEEITRERVAQAMANHILIGLQKEEEEQAREEAEAAGEASSLPIAEPRHLEQKQLEPTAQIPLLAAQHRRVRMGYLASPDTDELLGGRKGLGMRRLKLPEKRLGRSDTRRTLQRDFAKKRTIESPGARAGGFITVRRPGSGAGLPRRIVLAGEIRQRSLSPIETAKRREKSLTLTNVDSSAFQESQEGVSLSPADTAGSGEMRRRTLTRRHLEEPRPSALPSLGKTETKRTVRLDSSNGAQSKRTLSLSTRGFSGDMSDTADGNAEGTTKRRLSSVISTRKSSGQDAPLTEKRRLSPPQVEREGREGPAELPPAGASSSALEKTDTSAGITRRSLASSKGDAHAERGSTSLLTGDLRKERRIVPIGSDSEPPASGTAPEPRVDDRKRSLAPPTAFSQDFGGDSGSVGHLVSRRRLRSPIRGEPASSGSSADTRQAEAGEERDSRTTPAAERTSTEAGGASPPQLERRSRNGSRFSGRTLSLGQAKDSDATRKSSSRRSETPHKKD